jgi:hypothetical protein
VEVLAFILMGMVLGAAGGVLYIISKPQVSPVLLMVSCVVGIITSIALLDLALTKGLIVAMIAIGYAGTDMVASFFYKGGE